MLLLLHCFNIRIQSHLIASKRESHLHRPTSYSLYSRPRLSPRIDCLPQMFVIFWPYSAGSTISVCRSEFSQPSNIYCEGALCRDDQVACPRLHRYRLVIDGTYRDRLSVCTWLREVCSCSCLPVLPGPAWVLLSKFCIFLCRSLYRVCSLYRLTIQVDSNLPLTSKQKFCFSMWPMY